MGKLEDMALLVEVAEAGGLSAAGRRLSLSPATMTARLKAIEERYQTRLFHRSTRALSPSPGRVKSFTMRHCACWKRCIMPSRYWHKKGRAQRQHSSFRPL